MDHKSSKKTTKPAAKANAGVDSLRSTAKPESETKNPPKRPIEIEVDNHEKPLTEKPPTETPKTETSRDGTSLNRLFKPKARPESAATTQINNQTNLQNATADTSKAKASNQPSQNTSQLTTPTNAQKNLKSPTQSKLRSVVRGKGGSQAKSSAPQEEQKETEPSLNVQTKTEQEQVATTTATEHIAIQAQEDEKNALKNKKDLKKLDVEKPGEPRSPVTGLKSQDSPKSAASRGKNTKAVDSDAQSVSSRKGRKRESETEKSLDSVKLKSPEEKQPKTMLTNPNNISGVAESDVSLSEEKKGAQNLKPTAASTDGMKNGLNEPKQDVVITKSATADGKSSTNPTKKDTHKSAFAIQSQRAIQDDKNKSIQEDKEKPAVQEDIFTSDILNDIPSIHESHEDVDNIEEKHILETKLLEEAKKGEKSKSPKKTGFEADYLNPITLKAGSKELSPKFIHQFAFMRAYAYGSFMESERMNDTKGLIGSFQTPPGTTERTFSKKTETSSRDHKVTKKHFYYDILREIESMKFNQTIDEADEMIMKAEKSDQDAHMIMEKRLGRRFANGTFYLMKQYSEDSGSNSNRMSCNTLIKMLRDFGILNEKLTKEAVMILYSKRCNRNLIDFGAFLDILYKISKLFSNDTEDRNLRFQNFLEEYLIAKIPEVLGKKPYRTSISKIQVFGNEYSLENQALRLFEGYEDLLKHLFILHSTYDFKYHDRAFISLRSYRKFIYSFSLVPLMVHLKEAYELFRRFQIGEYSIIDFRGFIKIIAIMAHLGFSKPQYANKYDTYSKKVAKLFEFLQEANSRLSDELVLKCLTQVKEDKVIA